MIGQIRLIGDAHLSAELVAAGEHAEIGMKNAVSNAADLALTKIRANASGRPGPNAPTGDYRRSWSRQTTNRGGDYAVSVGTNRPQGRRLEFGFIGTDSLGRVYHQPAYPHVEPAIPVVFDYFTKEMDKVRAFVISGGTVRVGPSL